MSRFDHIKKQKNLPSNRDDFIQGAIYDPVAKKAKKQPDKENLLLILTGKMDRENECNKPSMIYLKKDVATDLEKYCDGNQQAIINYLVRKGLEALKAEGELIIEKA